MNKFFELYKMTDIIIASLEPMERLTIVGVIVDSVVAETGKSLEEIYDMMLKMGKEVEDELGVMEI